MNEVLYSVDMFKNLRLSKDGVWFHNNQAFTNQNLSALFHRSITWDQNEKKYYVTIGKGRASFSLEDTAYFVQSITIRPTDVLLTLYDESREALSSPIQVGADNALFCTVKESHIAKFLRAPYQTLIEFLVDEETFKINDLEFKIEPRRIED